MAHRHSKRSESLPSTLPTNGQYNHEDNPNHLVYKKVSSLTSKLSPIKRTKIFVWIMMHYVNHAKLYRKSYKAILCWNVV